jgi:hypothetical protein
VAEGPRIVTLVRAASVLAGCHAAPTPTAIARTAAMPTTSSRRGRCLLATSVIGIGYWLIMRGIAFEPEGYNTLGV